MGAHDDVLPIRSKYGGSSQEEDALRQAYDKLDSSRNFTKAQRQLQQDIDQRKTGRRDLDAIRDVASWSARHDGRLPLQSRNDQEQNALFFKLQRLQQKSTDSDDAEAIG